MLKRLKYVSRFSQPMSTAEVTAIAGHSAENNKKLGITGMMIASGGVFFQVLEGEPQAVDELYLRIAKDPRHRDVTCLRVEDDRRDRLFGDWSMRLIDLDREAVLRALPLQSKMIELGELQEKLAEVASEVERAIWAEVPKG